MCLKFDFDLTKQLIARTDKIIGYKVYMSSFSLVSPFNRWYTNGHINRHGTYHSSDILFGIDISDATFGIPSKEHHDLTVNITGFHAFLTREGAEAYIPFLSIPNATILQIEIDPKDVVAAGLTTEDESSSTVVCRKMSVTEKNYQAAFAPYLHV